MIRPETAKLLADAVKLFLSEYPPERDGMDYRLLPYGVKSMRSALAAYEAELASPVKVRRFMIHTSGLIEEDKRGSWVTVDDLKEQGIEVSP